MFADLLMLLAFACHVCLSSTELITSFVYDNDGTLMLDNQIYRFAGPNIYWLALCEHGEESPDATRRIKYPAKFRVQNILDTAVIMGANVIRAHTLGISTGHPLSLEPDLGYFNLKALDAIHYAIAEGKKRGIRFIVPLTDNWKHFHGGKHDFLEWRSRGLFQWQFYTNQQVRDDFKEYIRTLVNSVNPYTGLALYEEPAILAWETGNELDDAEPLWTWDIASFLKNNLGVNSLVIDGSRHFKQTGLNMLDPISVMIPDTDIVTEHFYPIAPEAVAINSRLARAMGKAYYVGEYGWKGDVVFQVEHLRGMSRVRDFTQGLLPGFSLGSFHAAIENSPVAGDTFWSLFGHGTEHGYVLHHGGDDPWSLRYPGDNIFDRQLAQDLRSHAFRMRGLEIPPHPVPGPPVITHVDSKLGHIQWRGTAGADKYTIERSDVSYDGPWRVICDACVTDYAEFGIDPRVDERNWLQSRWYRMKAHNLDGVSGSYSVYHVQPNRVQVG